ncbi:hypothetical protein LDENG_00091710 [Lucifuga dentata]|nr:hypothetical protein LDENG_00091710 [Lucifuga dentata]
MAPYEEVNVHGYDEFCKAVSDSKGKEIFAYFSGDKDAQGKSWCPDCVKAEQVVRGEMSHLPENSVFIYCQVGERAYWKDPNNDFKKTLKLSGVPTLLRYGTPQKLVEEECFKADLWDIVGKECNRCCSQGDISGAHSYTALTPEDEHRGDAGKPATAALHRLGAHLAKNPSAP